MRCLLLVCFTALLLGAGGTEDDAKKIQGTWTVVKAEKDNMDDGGKGNKFVFKDDTLSIDDGKDRKKGAFKLDASKKPKEIDLEQFGPSIYELDGDNLKLCWKRLKERPTKFDGGADSVLVVLKRVKK